MGRKMNDLTHCQRCRRPAPALDHPDLDRWMDVFRPGVTDEEVFSDELEGVIGFICPNCFTSEETGEVDLAAVDLLRQAGVMRNRDGGSC